LPNTATDICQIIDEAGTFLVGIKAFEKGMALYRAAVKRYPNDATLFQGLGYCASKVGLHEEAVHANRRAVELQPDNQKLVNGLGWTLAEAGFLVEAVETLERAVAMDPCDKLARENLRLCKERAARRKIGEAGNAQTARRGPRTVR
jgi:Tfp pilus assembly protein PilF